MTHDHRSFSLKIMLSELVCLFLVLSVFESLYLIYKTWLNRSSLGSIVTSLRAGSSEIRIQAGAQKCLSPPKCPDRLWDPPSLTFSANCGSFIGRKRMGHKLNYLPVSSIKVVNEWSYKSAPLIYLNGVDRENLTFAFTELDMNVIPDTSTKCL
jgi:hypothetical protein